ncbi:hypothetical protein GLOIN_2v1780935 [Rhizophagus irregularis DAOM 181602=DAOM 197198]|uniref:Uncharacterized protein n=1 Tax=Rhizophagus irregularis (strain DAOM 181602 / DAOM 197198 / MUCL 43194) TaxID=747089 RepID=A0A2P4PL96_RHIID|nr:hypothetical protein GLOIN_2v1780935 [Rhizophagus irregularis DAOM 181602=DAOM 197198]POG66166.1 hypothetical protein GLOIN_2v1780935 [Rhizophagus irregularis DAOM 181602=DAOM 197198]|eukprot:XP_025173032.1 hypothetical protein GLOIN_2v1780935 [Rhizophagus irregularis DAOM 181602=DAOM 197198]
MLTESTCTFNSTNCKGVIRQITNNIKILLTEEYNTETFVKDYRPLLKELGRDRRIFNKELHNEFHNKDIPYNPKEKGCTVTFAEMASKNLDVGNNRNTSLTPPVGETLEETKLIINAETAKTLRGLGRQP